MTSLPRILVWLRIRSHLRKNNFASEDNIAIEFNFAVNIIPSKGCKFALGCKFAMGGNFATKGILAKKGKGTKACEFAYDRQVCQKCRLILKWLACQLVGAGFFQWMQYLRANRLSGE
jgi:hypothetical protein